MTRKILIQVTMPAVAIGILLFGACLASTWYVNRLQTNLAHILTENVKSQQAAQQLEIQVRRLRFHSFLSLVEPTPELEQRIKADHENFEKALQLARESANTPEEQHCVLQIEEGYRRYTGEIDQLLASAARDRSQVSLAKLADTHPVGYVVTPSQELLRVNQEMTESISEENQRVAQQAKWTMILLGFLGPVGGLIGGYGIARGLSRSIYQLSVRVRDMAHRLDRDVASVSIEADGDLNILDRQLQQVVRQVEDVAERQQRHQREMVRAEQLATVGQLAAGVAHEVRNPLTAVKMLVEVALRSENRKPLSLDDLRVIHREIARLEQTIQGLLDFARLPAPQRSTCDLRDLVTGALDLVQVRARQQKVEIAAHLPPSAVSANIDRGQLRTVLVNLFLNAIDAMPRGGQLQVNLEGAARTGVRFVITDTGTGIPPEIIERLFTPFTTTKPTGTGLGLSISRRIVEEHGGQLVAANRPEGGARFTISLPPSPDSGWPGLESSEAPALG
jgi:signal transduction histidine kinase